MTPALLTRAVCALFLFSAPLAAEGIMVDDAYIRSSTAKSTSGAAFMVVMNHSSADDRLIGASSDVADKVELHSHRSDDNGIMRMGEIEGGVAIAADEMHAFKRGGDHLMFMGLKESLVEGAMVPVTLEFEKAGAVEIEVMVDQDRKPNHGKMKHDKMKHDKIEHGDMKHDHGDMDHAGHEMPKD
ncbi:MAG: copper chaperone PCu(A)C [Sulfitobacter litoralis]|jgi:copper(I)-binding protein|nr:copper chaperone PCu(A)C [Sulfitobacter litoralis]|tara:strand:+ start:1030 stop:1584 length:555 start_codon:yes stop_codon:yes gene_type:complete